MNYKVQYKLTIPNSTNHILQVTCELLQPNPSGQVVSMPAWLPGSYKIRDFAKYVIKLQAFSAGKDVVVTKIDKNTWQCAPCGGKLTLIYTVIAFDASPRGAYIDQDKVFLDAARVFLQIHGQEREATLITIEPIANKKWRLMTTCNAVTKEANGFGNYDVQNYYSLIDHPIVMGDFTCLVFNIAKVPHKIVLLGVGAKEFANSRLQHDVRVLCHGHIAMFGELPKMPQYVFYLQVSAKGYGGLEHRESCSLLCSREALPYKNDTKLTDEYISLLGLFSHEYFHLWNVKRLRPKELLIPELTQEQYLRELWIYEGITSYFDDFNLLLSGCIKLEQYLEICSKNINRLLGYPGYKYQTLEESSFDAWIKFYAPEAHSINTEVSYYNKGAVVALLLDLELLTNSQGKCGLRQVMRELWLQYGQNERGLDVHEFEEFVDKYSGQNLKSFFVLMLRTTAELPLATSLQRVGINIQEEEQDPLLQLGLLVQAGTNVVSHVIAASVAENAGICPGDTLVAFNDYKWPQDLATLYKHSGQNITIALFRDEVLRQIEIIKPTKPVMKVKLQAIAENELTQEQQILRKSWLQGL